MPPDLLLYWPAARQAAVPGHATFQTITPSLLEASAFEGNGASVEVHDVPEPVTKMP
jgi:hypothetical protein